ncbi:MAG: MFS transporter [Phycisphaerae bacterium]|nr:MFS transporter [Phycisphaerae bacterium]
MKYRNYRLFFSGQSLSLVGTWMQKTAMIWLVWRLTNSALVLGLVTFAGQIPGLLLTPYGGVVADRFNKKRILIATQILPMIQALILGLLVLTDQIAVWHLILLNIVLGVINAFDMPIRQAFVVEMIDNRDDLGNTIALNSSMVTGAKLLGPPAAGLLIAATGEGVCFVINAASYLPVIVSLLLMKINFPKRQAHHTSAWQQLKGGFVYTFGFAPVKAIILLVAMVSVAAMPYVVLVPVFTSNILHGGAHTFGFLMGASGVGALMGAAYLAARKTVLGLDKVIVAATTLFGIGLIAFSFSTVLWLSMPFMLIAGFGMMVQFASCNTVLQTIVDDEFRGRVMSFYTMSFIGTMPFGSLLAGILADAIGSQPTVLLGGLFCLLSATLFAKKLPQLRKIARPIYVKKGIIKEVASALQNTSQLTIPPEE